MDIHVKLTIDDRIVTVARRLRHRLSMRTLAGVLALGVVCGAVVVLADPIDNPHTFAAGDPIRASDLNESLDALYTELNARVVRTDQTIAAADCAELKLALASLDDRHIAANATVTIELAEGTFDCKGSVVVDHSDGGHIQIVGQGNTKTKLTFFNVDGVVVPMTRNLGLIDELTISGSGNGGRGVLVQGAAAATLGSHLVVRDFDEGVATDGGFIRADGVISEGNAINGFFARAGGVIWAAGAIARDNAADGFSATLGSAILADSASAEDNKLFGFNASDHSVIEASAGASASNNPHGYDANNHSTISVHDCSATMSSQFGFAAWNHSFIEAANCASNDNPLFGFSARMGSFVHITGAGGNSVTYPAPGVNMLNAAENSFIEQD